MPNPKDISFSDALAAVRGGDTQDHSPSSAQVAGDLAMSIAPHIQGVLEEVGTNPSIAKGASSLARYGTEAALAGKGIATANPMEILAAPTAGWQAGKGAYRLAQTGQTAARKLVGAAEAAAPVARLLSVAGAVQGLGDLAAINDPHRADTHIVGARQTIDPNDPKVKAQIAVNRANALKWAEDHPSPSVQGLKNAFADMIAAIKSHVESK